MEHFHAAVRPLSWSDEDPRRTDRPGETFSIRRIGQTDAIHAHAEVACAPGSIANAASQQEVYTLVGSLGTAGITFAADPAHAAQLRETAERAVLRVQMPASRESSIGVSRAFLQGEAVGKIGAMLAFPALAIALWLGDRARKRQQQQPPGPPGPPWPPGPTGPPWPPQR